ncbi:aminotransferase class V [Haliangium ochraceum DSM 14365]|uniref:Probable cysteine desulfurase n=1 Tax=Haliangium ochraceum (strain DSM 14365 / JCM 11303 / SMP-2) TaxID=502025 RepID=D0LMC9_HALO1|nr:aminotransferase class V [Haliangium ochraceum DSM 14365]
MSSDVPKTAAPRSDFPILSREIDGRPLVYLDNAATTPKPSAVTDAVVQYYSRFTGNAFRGNHLIAEETSEAFDGARRVIAEFINADPLDITFWMNATDAINAVAHGLGLTKDDRVIASVSEHHSNFVPWLHNATVDVLPVDEHGLVSPDELRKRLEQPARLVALGHVSNVTGAIQPIAEIAEICQEHEVPLLIDGAQGCPHIPVDVEELGCSFYAFSGHKMFGPTGVGVLWADADMMELLTPARYGGGMVVRVLKDWFEPKDPPHSFEAGTPNIAGVIGLGAAVEYIRSLDRELCDQHERALVTRMLERAASNTRLKLIGPSSPDQRVSLVTMQVVDAPGQTADHVSFKLSDRYAIMTRSGTHCAQPYHQFINAPTTLRLSAYLYTTLDEVDRAFDAIDEILA